MTNRRVALLTNFLPPYRLAVLKELERHCDSLQVFVSTQMEEGWHWAPDSGGMRVLEQRSIHWRTKWRHPHKFTESLSLHFPYDTIPQLARFQPNAIVSGELGLRTLQASIYRGLMRRSRLIVWATLSEVTEQARGPIRPLLRRALLNAADAVVVNGDSGSRYVCRMGARGEKVFRVPQTTDLSVYTALPAIRTETLRRRILYSGRLIELKGLLPFLTQLAAFAIKHSSQQLEFWVLGEGPQREALAAFPMPNNLRLNLLGHVAYEKLPEIYRQCGILAFPTLSDEWGLAVVEALASGLPVLGSLYSQAVDELVTDGFNGWTFRPDREEEVISALSRALSVSFVELDAMAEAARKSVIGMTPAFMAEQIISAVDYALADHSGRS